jgi:diguanylate cyclase (GGDEF)-like protein
MKRTELTLLEQMQISDVEISRRMELLGLKPASLTLLASHKYLIEEHIDEMVNEFYAKQTEIDEISLLIGDADTMKRLRAAQRRYVLDLFGGFYDGEYVNNRLRIGMVHKRIGVEPKLYLSAVVTLKKIIIETLKRLIENEEVLEQTLDALEKLIYFDTTLVFDTYIDSLVGEIESAKKRTEEYARGLETKVAERTKQLEDLSRIDPLTNIYNQRAFQEFLRRELLVATRNQQALSLVYFDVDKFKLINDELGHQKGDEVLKHVGQVMLNSVRTVDIPCRYGGDEFCLILPNCDLDNARLICKKIIDGFIGKYPDFSLSIGISQTGPDEFMDIEALIKMADNKMYEAKKVDGPHIQS